MWFTRVSLRNPVFATMVMLAFVVLGLFSLQRLQIDQFPNVDFPVVVISTEYPGAAPEIVESEVTRKIEEGVNGLLADDEPEWVDALARLVDDASLRASLADGARAWAESRTIEKNAWRWSEAYGI